MRIMPYESLYDEKAGVETTVKNEVPEIKAVVAIDSNLFDIINE